MAQKRFCIVRLSQKPVKAREDGSLDVKGEQVKSAGAIIEGDI